MAHISICGNYTLQDAFGQRIIVLVLVYGLSPWFISYHGVCQLVVDKHGPACPFLCHLSE
jgi:hypothetical protein